MENLAKMGYNLAISIEVRLLTELFPRFLKANFCGT